MHVLAPACEHGWCDAVVMPPLPESTRRLYRSPEGRLLGGIARGLSLHLGVDVWLLRLALAPVSTLAGFRAWVLEECPVAPGRRASPPAEARPARGGRTVPRKATKTARFLSLVTERHGPLASIPLDRVAQVSAALASSANLHAGAARAALRKAVLAARNGDPS